MSLPSCLRIPNFSRRKESTLVLLFFLLLAVVFTWPLALHLHDGILGGHGDPLLNTWILSWDARTAFTHPTGLFQANIIYPSRDVLAYSEHLITLGVAAAPIYYLSGNPLLAYNLVLLLGLVFTAFAAYLLARELTGSRWGAVAAGVFFAFCPYKISKLGHIHILLAPFMPLMLLYLYRYLGKGGRRNLVLFGLFLLLQSLCSWHYLVFCSLSAGLLWLWFALLSRRRSLLPRLGYALAAMLAALALTLPFALPYLRAHARLPDFERTLREAEYYSASLSDYLRVPRENLLYGHAPAPFSKGDVMPEGVLFPGITTIALALAGLFIRRREDDYLPAFDPWNFRYGALYFLVLALLGFLLSFGPKMGGITNYLYTVPFHLGLFKVVRFSARFYVLCSLGLSMLAAFGVTKVSLRVSARTGSPRAGRLAAAFLMALLLLECLTFNLKVYPVPTGNEVPEVYRWLSRQGDVRIIELPAPKLGEGAYRYDAWMMGYTPEDILTNMHREGMLVYLSTYHWKKTVNGYSGYLPFFYRRIMTEMQAFPSRRSLELLGGLDIDYVLWHWDWVPEEERDACRNRLDAQDGISRVADIGQVEVFGVAGAAPAGDASLEAAMACPRAVPGGESFNMSLMVRNEGKTSYTSADEEQYRVRISFSDPSGKVFSEQILRYRPPFYLAMGEETPLPLSPAIPPPPGEYNIVATCMDGPLVGNILAGEIAVRELAEMAGSGSLDASLALDGDTQPLNIPEPDGLFPVVVRIRNTGDNLWRCRWEEKDLLGRCPFGLVYLEAVWAMGDARAWEKEGAVLPCDVAPGQEIAFTVLVRPPDQRGDYTLLISAYDKDVGRFGEIATSDVRVAPISEGGAP
ncbi:MAG: hypothetical protein H5T74_08130 [Actinobacteria bacterium]|nr:hypothetical protein [Actinomycetota bacterium]